MSRTFEEEPLGQPWMSFTNEQWERVQDNNDPVWAANKWRFVRHGSDWVIWENPGLSFTSRFEDLYEVAKSKE